MVKDKGRMFVLKRNGREEPVHFDKITSRIQKLCYNLDMDYIDPAAITLKVPPDLSGHFRLVMTTLICRSSPVSIPVSPPSSWTTWLPRSPPP